MIGMVHVAALPGTPRAALSPKDIVASAVREAEQLASAGFDAIIVENMHDRPYLRDGMGAEVTACMAAVGAAVRAAVQVPIGIQILGGGAFEALAVAHATGLDFVRCENFVFAHVADEGLMDRALAGPLLRYRTQIGAERVAIVADIKKKHASHALTADLDVAAFARAAEFFLADGVVVTGSETGSPVSPADLRSARAATRLPVLVGSGADPATVRELLTVADAVIVGSWIKKDGDWTNPVDPARAAEFARAAKPAGNARR
ncbi:MAG: BtpA/SgcQ family protein [Phycisphaerae bacterium]|nr:BtpA/SgcQ family protein [Phycisphaerae bacterium]